MTRTESGLWVPATETVARETFGGSVAERLRPAERARVPKTDEELWDWVARYAGVHIPRESCCAGHSAPFAAFAEAFFARVPISVWLASRGFGGKSFLLATLAWTESVLLGAGVSVLGGSGEQSENVHSYLAGTHPNAIGRFWDAPLAPRHLLKTDPTKRTLHLTNGGQVKALMASSRSVRGPHPQRLRLDECDEMDLLIFDAAMGQTMEARGVSSQIVCSSTHHKSDGTFTEIRRRAREKEWPLHEWCYRENLTTNRVGWLAPAEIERKRAVVPKSMWEIEYELQLPSPAGRAIDPESVKALFDKSLGNYYGGEGERIRIVEPFHLREFYHGTDWARDEDWTIIHTMQETKAGNPDKLAAWVRLGRRPWPQMIKAHNDRIREYGGASAHDSTGVGGVCDDYLEVPSAGFNFTNRRERSEMLSNYVAAIENGTLLVYPMIEYAYSEHLYATNEDLYMPSGHLPDSVAGAALAWWAKTYGSREYDSDRWASVKR
jgi:hypothetical protein